MVKSLQKTDTHIVAHSGRQGGVPTYGENVYAVYNKRTGEEVERFNSFQEALAGQAKYDAYAKTHGL